MSEAIAPEPSPEVLRGIASASKRLLSAVAAQATAVHELEKSLRTPRVDSDERWRIAKAVRDAEAESTNAVAGLVKAHIKAIQQVESP
jgi:hypothetical protein